MAGVKHLVENMNKSLQPLPHWLPALIPTQTPDRRQWREVGEAQEDETRKFKQNQYPEGFHGTSSIHHQAPISAHCSAHYPPSGHPASCLHLQPKNTTCLHSRFCFVPIWLTLGGQTQHTCNFQKGAEPWKSDGGVEGEVLLPPECGRS